MTTCKCDKKIEDGRIKLGLTTCLDCGELEAQEEIKRKQKRVGLSYNKGGLVYLGDDYAAKKAALDIGRKDGGLYQVETVGSSYYTNLPTSKVIVPKRSRTIAGYKRVNGELIAFWKDIV